MLPEWLDFALSENTAAAMLRGLNSLTANWGELIATAQTILGYYQEMPLDRVSSLYEEVNAQALTAAARILDTASQSTTELPEEHKQNLRLQAIVAFGMCANFSSATAVARQLPRNVGETYPDIAALLATSAPQLIGELLANAPLTLNGQRYLEALNRFLVSGKVEHAEKTRELLIVCLLGASSSFESALFRSSRICLEHIITLSTARTLRNPILKLPDEYVARLVDHGISVLLPPQYKAITSKRLLSSQENALISLPTSTGKTLLGEMCLVSSFGGESGLVCFLAPYISLGNQVAKSFKQHLPEKFRIHTLVGGYRTTEQLEPESYMEVIVATPERFDSLLRFRPELLQHIRCVVCDEAHIIENSARGIRVEGIITRLKLLNRKRTSVRIVLLSAVIANPQSLQNWIHAPDASVIIDKWKPTARRLAIWHQDGRLVWYQGDDPIRRTGVSSQSPLGSLPLIWPRPNITATEFEGEINQRLPDVHANVAYLSETLLRKYGGPLLMVCATKGNTRGAAKAMADRLPLIQPLPASVGRIISTIQSRYPSLLAMCRLLGRGVAYHNSSVPADIRDLIEDAVKKKELFAICSTTTLAEGVDLPFRFTILVDWLLWGERDLEPISALLFRNVAGRCGRAGVFTEGDTIVFDNPLGKLNYTAERLRFRKQSEIFLIETTSPLRSSIEGTDTTSQQDVRYGVLSSQFLAAIAENLDDENLATSFAQETYAASRINDVGPTQAKMNSVVRLLLDPVEGELATMNSPLALTKFGEAGTLTQFSPFSCRQIRRFLSSYFQPRMFHEIDEFGAEALRALAELPEQGNRYLPQLVKSSKTRITIKSDDLQTIIAKWLFGEPLESIFASLPAVLRSKIAPPIGEWLKGLSEPSRWDSEYEKFLDFVSAVLQGFLPWILWSCEHLKVEVEDEGIETDWSLWSRMMEQGVSTPWAVGVLEAGAQVGRTAVMMVTRHLPEQFQNEPDPVGEALLSLESNIAVLAVAFEAAFDDAGEERAALRRDIQRLQTWLWHRAGLTIFPRY